MGTPEKYLEANLAWAQREGALSAAEPGAHPEADVVNSVLHQDVTVEEGATVRDAVVLEGGHVGRGRVCEPLGPWPQRVVGPGRWSTPSRSWAMAGLLPPVMS